MDLKKTLFGLTFILSGFSNCCFPLPEARYGLREYRGSTKLVQVLFGNNKDDFALCFPIGDSDEACQIVASKDYTKFPGITASKENLDEYNSDITKKFTVDSNFRLPDLLRALLKGIQTSESTKSQIDYTATPKSVIYRYQAFRNLDLHWVNILKCGHLSLTFFGNMEQVPEEYRSNEAACYRCTSGAGKRRNNSIQGSRLDFA